MAKQTRAQRRAAERAVAKGQAQPPESKRQRNIVVAIVGALLVGGVVAMVVTDDGPNSCPGHWHGTFAMDIDGQHVSIPQPPYSLESGGMSTPLHLHDGDEQQFHFEPSRARCVGVRDAMRAVGVELKPGELQLGEEYGPQMAGTYEDDGNRTVRIFLEPPDAKMGEVSIGPTLGHQMLNGEKMLITYGEYTDDEISQLMRQIRRPSGTSSHG